MAEALDVDGGGCGGGGDVGGDVEGDGGGGCVGLCVGELLCSGVGAGEEVDAVGLLCAGEADGVVFVGLGIAAGLVVGLPLAALPLP